MTTQNEPARKYLLVGVLLPWLIAACGLAFYLTTLNHWITSYNVMASAADMGMPLSPQLNGPLFYVLTYPLHWLPAKFVPIGLNIFSAVCGVLTLALLARSVSLLPHDRTHGQRLRENGEFARMSVTGSWIPPVLAVAVLGLQLTIWESATGGAKELLDLLAFAYVIRCVLEYRISERDSWLFRAALVYGMAMTGNWAFIALLPALLFALVWIRGVNFFNLRFLFFLTLCGFAGLLLYLILPAVYVHTEAPPAPLAENLKVFWQVLKANLKSQKDFLAPLPRMQANIFILLSITSLLPLLLLGIRWASRFGDPSALGSTISVFIFHVVHAALLLACIWAAFDPGFSLRHILWPGGASLLYLLVYISTLSIGYFAGYLLIVSIPLRGQSRRIAPWKTALNRFTQGAMILLVVLVSAGLIYKNLPRIKIVNSDALSFYASQMTQKLPDRAVVLSDDPVRTFLVRAWMTRNPAPSTQMILDTPKLTLTEYFNKQQELYPQEWLPRADAKSQSVDPYLLVQLIIKLAEQRPVYYLHPSFGYYFEAFYPVPHGLVYELRRYPTNSVSPPTLDEKEIAENDTFWKNIQPKIDALRPLITEPLTGRNPGFRNKFLTKLHIPYEPAMVPAMIGSFYSISLNLWGVQAEIASHLNEANRAFTQAAALNPDNVAAKRNLEFNNDLQAGIAPEVKAIKDVQDDFMNAKYHDAQNTLRLCGPFDEPSRRFVQGYVFSQGGNLRQAAIEFERIVSLVPDYVPGVMALAKMYATPFPEKTLAILPRLRDLAQKHPDAGVSRYDVLGIQTLALFSAQRQSEAEQLLNDAMENEPKNSNLMALVFQLSVSFKSYTNALRAVDHILEAIPDDTGWLVNKAFIHIQLGDFTNAIPPLTKVLNVETNNTSARFDRAVAYLGCNQLDEAQKDYEILDKQFPRTFQFYYGLGEIAWRRKDTNTAAKYYDLYLANAPANTDEAKLIRERFQSLTPTTSTNSPAPQQ
jgi:tetratricopeptide (TPR) repeat protein